MNTQYKHCGLRGISKVLITTYILLFSITTGSAAKISNMSSKTQDVPDMQIIVNSKSSNKILMTREYIWAIFTFTIVNWENGQKIIVFAYPQNSSMLHDFVSEYFGMNTYMFQELIDEKTSASGRRPFIVSTEQQMILNVKSTPGSIGIIRSDTDTSAFNGIKRIILLD